MDISVLVSFIKNDGGIRKFYERLPHVTIAEAGVEPLKIRHLSDHPQRITLPNEKRVDLAIALFQAFVGSIQRKYRNRYQLTTDDELYVAERMKAKFPHWSINDVKCFEDMLVEARIPTSTYGDISYEMPTVSIPNLLGKAEVYDNMRPSRLTVDNEDPKSMQALQEKRSTGWRKSKFNCYTDYHKTHDSDGRLVVDPRKFGGTPPDDPGWDYQSHWDKWFRTHQFAGHPAPEDFNPVAYWKTQPDVQNNMEEDLYVQSVVQKLHKANRSLEYAVNFSTITNN